MHQDLGLQPSLKTTFLISAAGQKIVFRVQESFTQREEEEKVSGRWLFGPEDEPGQERKGTGG